MNVIELGINTLAAGTIIELKGKDLANVRFVKSRISEKARSDGADPLTYHHFSVAGRSFTIDSNDQESADMLMNKEQRRNIAILTLEATTHQVEEKDEDNNGTGVFNTRNSFRFVSVLSLEDFKTYSASAGVVAAEEAKLIPKATGKDVDAAVSKAMTNFMTQWQAAAKPVVNDAAPVDA